MPRPPWRSPRPDHPRSRGVYRIARPQAGISAGSSPLARGLPGRIVLHDLRGRIIPARAGFTRPRPASPTAAADHPRSRGVYDAAYVYGVATRGSSPLARGLRCASYAGTAGPRIIPARAGFTSGPQITKFDHGDHPRSRGVYVTGYWWPVVRAGSSPLARGLPSHSGLQYKLGGIIPARAGFTPWTGGGACGRPDHPRSRGVYSPFAVGIPSVMGSSPLARGLLTFKGHDDRVKGIIPARAGFTGSGRLFSSAGADHPRSRGVYD